jgi:hypothetical protein
MTPLAMANCPDRAAPNTAITSPPLISQNPALRAAAEYVVAERGLLSRHRTGSSPGG